MPKNPEISFAQAKQERSKKTLNDLLEAAHELVEGADPNLFTSRSLSKRSGYALGTLTKRLTSIEKVFLWAIKKAQQKKLEEMSQLIEDFDPSQPLEILMGELVDMAINNIQKVNPLVIRFYDERIHKAGNLHNFHHLSDPLVPAFFNAMKRDRTNTFRPMSEDELKLILRTTSVFIERPIVENESFVGTNEHRRLALKNMLRLLGQ
ncbi:hypothetical protein [Polynucleobacter sp. AP-Reno-20A-A9]|uniref:hypothetical protein n=1 Tax=Polynucleobacter sp. AP-Reno-20A-A9 TaxID=2576925 RepID=UPI001C0D7411|nr:hypothetical protein [Polynucleobacter sp. AP-Reno-20A-A9]MBU3627953.1 hypothetical protein [Polynucleobacter sp. AP-Reno-20A-A9]